MESNEKVEQQRDTTVGPGQEFRRIIHEISWRSQR
jgi:hypothetical protein